MRADRQKLVHAILFFHGNTRNWSKTKLYKLLHFFDFEIFSKTGSSPTGLRYYAWPMGPVPKTLQGEFRNPPADISAAMSISFGPSDDDRRDGPLVIRPKIEFNEKLFTRRELRVMRELAELYYDSYADDMILAAHDRKHPHGQPWHRVHEVEGRKGAEIPYELALERDGSISKERAEELADDAQMIAALAR